MDEPISPRPNIHYIGVIEDVGSRVVFKKYPIDLPRALIDDLEAIRNDDEHGNLLSLQKKLISHFPEEERKFFYSDYLAPNFGYQAAYLEQTNYYPVRPTSYWE